MIRIGLRAHDLGSHDSDKIIPFLKDAGFNSMQLVCHKALNGIETYDDPLTENDIANLKKSACDNNFTIALLGCYQDFANPDLKDYVLDLFKRTITYARALGVKYVATETSYNQDTRGQEELYLKTLIANTKEVCAFAADNGVSVLLEPVICQPLNNVLLCNILKQESECSNLKFIFDPCNIMQDDEISKQEELWASWLLNKAFTDNIAIVHLKDFVIGEKGKRQMMPLGQGAINYKILNKYFTSFVGLEALIREWERPEWVEGDINFMQKIVKAIKRGRK